MLKETFKKLTRHTQAWIIAMIAGWDDFDKCTRLLQRYVGLPEKFKLYQKHIDTFFIAQYPGEMNIIGWCGTKNILAWLSDFFAFTAWGDFHPGIYNNVKSQFLPEVKSIEDKTLYTMVTGQSKGGSDSIIANYFLRKSHTFKDVESWNFSGPPIADKNGIQEMAAHGVRNTNFSTDPFGPLPSDPTDDARIDCDHYGEDHQLWGGAGPADHSYHQITLHLSAWCHKEAVKANEKGDIYLATKFKNDSQFLLELAEPYFKHTIIRK